MDIFWENPLDNCIYRLYTLLKKRKQIRSVMIKGEKRHVRKNERNACRAVKL